MRDSLLIGTLVCLVVTAGAAAQPGSAEPERKAAGISGTWVILLEGHQVGLEVEEKSAGTLEGTLYIMGQRVLVDGTIEKGAFRLTSDAQVGDQHSQGALVKLTLTGSHQPDDTLEGEIELPRGPRKWTAERLRKP